MPSRFGKVSKYWLNGGNHWTKRKKITKGNIKNRVRSNQEASSCRVGYSAQASLHPWERWPLMTGSSCVNSGEHRSLKKLPWRLHGPGTSWRHRRHTLSVTPLRQRPSLWLGFKTQWWTSMMTQKQFAQRWSTLPMSQSQTIPPSCKATRSSL